MPVKAWRGGLRGAAPCAVKRHSAATPRGAAALVSLGEAEVDGNDKSAPQSLAEFLRAPDGGVAAPFGGVLFRGRRRLGRTERRRAWRISGRRSTGGQAGRLGSRRHHRDKCRP